MTLFWAWRMIVSATNWVPIREERMPPARTTKRKLKTSLVRKEKRLRNGIREREKNPRIFERKFAECIRAVSRHLRGVFK